MLTLTRNILGGIAIYFEFGFPNEIFQINSVDKYFPNKEGCENQHDSHVHRHLTLEEVFPEEVGHVADGVDENGRQECGEKQTQKSPLQHNLQIK